MPPEESRLLYSDLGHSGLDIAIARFRAFAAAHNDFEPTLRCVRKSGRRSWVIDVYLRERDANTKEGTDE